MKLPLLFLLLLISTYSIAQQADNKTAVVAFYNLENLFDTLDTPGINDKAYTPNGIKNYTSQTYNERIFNLTKVVAEIEIETQTNGLALIGLAEIENRNVLKDFVAHSNIKSKNYQIVHYNSNDERGIDVALLSNPKFFKLLFSKKVEIPLKHANGKTNYTRDVLWVYGLLNSDPIHILINHWPSRGKSVAESSLDREIAATINRKLIDSLLLINPNEKIIVMGDFNDEPVNNSVLNILKANPTQNNLSETYLYNPWYNYFKNNKGSIAYKGNWNMFDQIIISNSFINQNPEGYYFDGAHILNKPFITQQNGANKGYPYRAYWGNQYLAGYSDHYPVYIILKRK